MNTAPSKYQYVLAILYGILAFFIPATEPLQIFLAFLGFFFLGGILFGFFWPRDSWRWGLWVTCPVLAFLSLSVLFAGDFQSFFNKDLLLLMLVIASACLGGFIAAWYKNKLKISH